MPPWWAGGGGLTVRHFAGRLVLRDDIGLLQPGNLRVFGGSSHCVVGGWGWGVGLHCGVWDPVGAKRGE